MCILIAACHAVVVSMSDYWSLFTASLVYGFAFGVVYAQVPVIMLEVSGVQRYPRAVGLLNLTLGLADFLCGIVSGKTAAPYYTNYKCDRHMGKPTICIGENKSAGQLRSNCKADQRLCFRYSDSTFPLLLKSEISSF